MRLSGIIIFGALLVASAFARDPKVRQAWIRTYPQTSLNIVSDNIGHIIASGVEIDEAGTPTNPAPVVILNSHGKEIGSVSDIPGTIAADSAGRVFILSSESNSRVRVTAFAPLLSKVLWSNDRAITNLTALSPTIWEHAFIPDETGGVYLFGELGRVWNQQYFVVQFDGANTAPTVFHYFSRDGYLRQAIGAARAPNGNLHCIGSVTALYTSEPTILTYVPGAMGFRVSELRPGPPSSHWFNDVACDKDSNVVFAGSYKQNAFYRSSGQCLIEKRGPDLNYTWRTTHPAGYFATARSVTIDRQGNVIVLCSHGVTKYSPEGQMLWQTADPAWGLQVDRFGNVFLPQEISDEFGIEKPFITKLDPDGQRVWQVQIDDADATESSYVSSLVCDEKGGVYVAVRRDQGTTIVRFAEHGSVARR